MKCDCGAGLDHPCWCDEYEECEECGHADCDGKCAQRIDEYEYKRDTLHNMMGGR